MCFHVIPKILIFPVPWTRYIPMFLHHRLGSASFLFWTHPTDGNVIRTLHSDPSHLNLHSHSAVVVDGRDHGLDEFQEDKEVLVHARLQSKHNSMFGGSVISTLINYWYERRKSAVLLGQHTNTHKHWFWPTPFCFQRWSVLWFFSSRPHACWTMTRKTT